MASIDKRIDKDGKVTYRVRVRMRGQSLSETFTRKTDAKAWAKQTEAAIQEQRLNGTEARKHTFEQLVDRFIEYELQDRKSADDVKRHLNWWKKQIGGYRLSDITPEIIREHRDKLRKGKPPKKGRASGTVNRYLTSLSSAFSTASREWGWLAENPVSKVKKLTEPRGRVRYLSDDERNALLDACSASKSKDLYPIVVLALSTGMRRGEILGLTWDRVNVKRGQITLFETKNKEIRAIPITGVALEILKKRSKVRQIDTQLVFPGIDGKKPIDIQESWELALERAGIKDFRFHDLRHTAASYLAMSGATLAEIAEILGHKTLQMVKRYSHFSTDHVSGVISKLDDRMFGGE
jgi:integrase